MQASTTQYRSCVDGQSLSSRDHPRWTLRRYCACHGSYHFDNHLSSTTTTSGHYSGTAPYREPYPETTMGEDLLFSSRKVMGFTGQYFRRSRQHLSLPRTAMHSGRAVKASSSRPTQQSTNFRGGLSQTDKCYKRSSDYLLKRTRRKSDVDYDRSSTASSRQ